MTNFDLLVIGAGPGGYVAAIRSAQLGMKTALIEKYHLGGICLNWGCIPTKSLLKSAEVFNLIKHSDDFGIKVGERVNFDIKKIVERSRKVSSQLSAGIKTLLKKNSVTVIDGTGSFEDKKTININNNGRDTVIKANHFIIATGAKARILPGFEPDGNTIWTYKEAMIPTSLPKSLTIIGSGAIGIEFASFYNTFGTDVTVIEAQNTILPTEDEEISKIARKIFEEKGIKFYTNAKLLKQNKLKDGISVDFESDGKMVNLKSEKLLIAVGTVPNTENIGLEKINIKLQNGYVVVNEFYQTSEPGIYAIGDVGNAPYLAHKASHEGIIAVESIAGLQPKPITKTNIPGCIYSTPQIASVGLTEKSAKDAGYNIRIGRFPFVANGKALVLGTTEGLIKTIFDEATGELLGAHMIGHEVTELIQGYVIAKGLECTELDIMHTIFPHPTLSEMMHESVLQSYNKAIHI